MEQSAHPKTAPLAPSETASFSGMDAAKRRPSRKRYSGEREKATEENCYTKIDDKILIAKKSGIEPDLFIIFSKLIRNDNSLKLQINLAQKL